MKINVAILEQDQNYQNRLIVALREKFPELKSEANFGYIRNILNLLGKAYQADDEIQSSPIVREIESAIPTLLEEADDLKYLEKIMLNFKDTDYFISSRGSEGGYKLAHSPKEYNLKDIFEKLEGNIEIVSCLNEGVPCLKKNRCVSRILWKDINNLINDYLSTKTLEDLIKR